MAKKTRSKSARKSDVQEASAKQSHRPSMDSLAGIQNSGTTLELTRLRFAHYQPQGIESMALSHDSRLLAVGRENKSIEIWKSDTFAQLTIIPGNQNVDLRNLHWIEHSAVATQNSCGNPLYYLRTKGKK